MIWNWPMIDADKAKRAKSVKLTVARHGDNPEAIALGSRGEEYTVTGEGCTCKDFAIHHGSSPCKHMVKLAMEMGVLNGDGLTEGEQQERDIERAKDAFALAFGYYHVFGEKLLSDKEYDKLKARLKELGMLRMSDDTPPALPLDSTNVDFNK